MVMILESIIIFLSLCMKSHSPIPLILLIVMSKVDPVICSLLSSLQLYETRGNCIQHFMDKDFRMTIALHHYFICDIMKNLTSAMKNRNKMYNILEILPDIIQRAVDKSRVSSPFCGLGGGGRGQGGGRLSSKSTSMCRIKDLLYIG